MDPLLSVAAALASLAATYLFLPWLIRSLHGTSAMGKDLNKPHKPLVPEMGGLAVILGFSLGVVVLVLFGAGATNDAFYFAALAAILGAGVVGLLDDMFRIRNRTKALLPFLLALPLGVAVYSAGDRSLLGFDLGVGIVFAVALGVTSAGNAANMLEGLNGLGSGLAVIITTTLIVLSILEQADEGLFLLFPLLGALLAFLWFNRYPARVFPGDSMTLFSGAAIASAAIISSPPLKTVGAFLFLPMILEFILKARGRFRAENYGRPDAQGRLMWDGRIESLSHAIMRWRPLKEWQIVAILWGIEASVCAVALVLVVAGL